MEPGVGRGAPEIDILEAMGGEKGKLPNSKVQRPYFSTSLQVRIIIFGSVRMSMIKFSSFNCFLGCSWSFEK
jgi:hypothetical protein